MRIVVLAIGMAIATAASASTVTVTDRAGHKKTVQVRDDERVIIDPVTGKTRSVAPETMSLKNHDDAKGELIDVRKPASADGYFDLSKYMGPDQRPCGGIKSLTNWGKPPPGVAMYLAQCRNGLAYVIAQQLSTGKTRFAKAERVSH